MSSLPRKDLGRIPLASSSRAFRRLIDEYLAPLSQAVFRTSPCARRIDLLLGVPAGSWAEYQVWRAVEQSRRPNESDTIRRLILPYFIVSSRVEAWPASLYELVLNDPAAVPTGPPPRQRDLLVCAHDAAIAETPSVAAWCAKTARYNSFAELLREEGRTLEKLEAVLDPAVLVASMVLHANGSPMLEIHAAPARASRPPPRPTERSLRPIDPPPASFSDRDTIKPGILAMDIAFSADALLLSQFVFSARPTLLPTLFPVEERARSRRMRRSRVPDQSAFAAIPRLSVIGLDRPREVPLLEGDDFALWPLSKRTLDAYLDEISLTEDEAEDVGQLRAALSTGADLWLYHPK